ncbi:MAG: hypothetical protein GX886_13985 [Comamonadaceae bacterium]|nr:hypothetical protein [Comamonadaceae bacterium]
MMPNDISPELVKSPWVAGAFGAIVALRGVPGITWGERLFNAFSGLMIAGYISPAAADYLGLEGANMQGATAFLFGLFGLNLVAAIVETIRTTDFRGLLPWKK